MTSSKKSRDLGHKVIIFWDFLIFYQILRLPQVKQSVIIINIHGVYELPHEFTSDLRIIYLKNLKTLLNYSLVFSLPPKIKILSILTKISVK